MNELMRMIHHVGIGILLIFIWLPIFSQTVTVVDGTSGESLPAVQIFSDEGHITTTSNNGTANLNNFKSDTAIHFRYVGYKERILSYTEIEHLDFKIALQESSVSLGEVVVSANRWEQDQGDVPARIEQILARQIAFNNPQTAADLLGQTGAVFVQKSQYGGGSPMLRGFATNRVLLVVDGVRMNNAIFRGGNLQNVISLDPHSIANAEVLFGASSVIYGSDAIGGVMDFHTLEPNFSADSQLQVSGQAMTRYATSSQEKTAHTHINLGWKKWALTTSISFSDFGDLRMGTNGPEEYLRPTYQDRINGVDTVLPNPNERIQRPTGFNQYSLMQKIRFRPAEEWLFDYGFHYSRTSDYPRYDRLTEMRNGTFRSAEWYYGPQVWNLNNLRVTHLGNTALYDQARLTAAYQFYKESRHDRSFGSISLRHRTEQVKAISINLDFDKSFSEALTIYYGGEFIHNTIGSSASQEDITNKQVTPTSTRYPDGSTWRSLAAYANAKIRLTENMVLNGGIRYNQFAIDALFDTTYFPFPFTQAENRNGAVTGSLGAVFEPSEHLRFYVNGSTGFRAPNIDDIGKLFDSEPGSVIVPNPELGPEYAYQGEFGFAVRIGNAVKFDASAFYTQLEDAIVRRTSTFEGKDSIVYDGTLSEVLSLQNAARAHAYGIQTNLHVDLPAGFSLRSLFSYQTGEEQSETEGDYYPLRHAAPWFGETHLVYERKGLKVDAYVAYQGSLSNEQLAPEEQSKPHLYAIDDQGRPFAQGWYTLNLKLAWYVTRNFTVNAGIENITDIRYRPYSSGISGPGINGIMAVRLKW